jgi:hypothetical protein
MTGKELAELFTDWAMTHLRDEEARDAFAEAIARNHRTEQQQCVSLMARALYEVAQYGCDLRNHEGVTFAKKATEGMVDKQDTRMSYV